MATSIDDWFSHRAMGWTHTDSYTSLMGFVERVESGEWIGKVLLPDERVARLSETYVSASAAMGAVERTWRRENKK